MEEWEEVDMVGSGQGDTGIAGVRAIGGGGREGGRGGVECGDGLESVATGGGGGDGGTVGVECGDGLGGDEAVQRPGYRGLGKQGGYRRGYLPYIPEWVKKRAGFAIHDLEGFEDGIWTAELQEARNKLYYKVYQEKCEKCCLHEY